MSVFTCLEVPCLAPNYCLGADSDEMWYVATPNPLGILSLNHSHGRNQVAILVLLSKRPGQSCHTLARKVYFLHPCS